MSIDLSKLSYEELKNLAKQVSKEVRVRAVREAKEAERAVAEKSKEVFLQMRDLAAKHGLTVDEVVATGGGKRRRRRGSGSAAPGPKSAPNTETRKIQPRPGPAREENRAGLPKVWKKAKSLRISPSNPSRSGNIHQRRIYFAYTHH